MYKRIDPAADLKDLVKEYWIIESGDAPPGEKKIVPDGFPEIIFHYGDPYRIRLFDEWKTQSKYLFAGQISRHFHLQNTGSSGMLGIKLMPAAAFRLRGIDMSGYTDRVVPLEEAFGSDFIQLAQKIDPEMAPDEKADLAEQHLLSRLEKTSMHDSGPVGQAVEMILGNNGLVKMGDIAAELEVSRRHLERSFKTAVGLSPKFYSRIIRFNYIFEIMKEGNDSWIDIALESGYFDQSHFIKEFREFTGEEPSRYGFDERNMANFFLNKWSGQKNG